MDLGRLKIMKAKKILVLGGRGLVGSSIIRELAADASAVLAPTSKELDLKHQQNVLDYFSEHRPQQVYLAAAKVGGIKANNTYRADFLVENLQIQSNVFEAAFKYDVDKLLFLGSSCIYPKMAPQPIKEEYLLTGPLEFTNEPYAIAKIAGLKLAENFRRQYGKKYFALMPTNLYGVNDNFDAENSHVIPGLMHRMHQAKLNCQKQFVVWGSGNPKREFLYVDDLARACVAIMNDSRELPFWLNVGTGEDIAIRDLANLIKEVVGYEGNLEFDSSQPDGTPRKLLDVSLIKGLGWKPRVGLREGLEKTYEFYLSKTDV